MDAPLLRIGYDETARLIRLESAGVWTADYLRDHLVRIADLFQMSREVNGFVHIVSDIRHAAVQTAEITDMVAAFSKRYHRPSDRVAMIVSSSLVKMQMRRLMTDHVTEFFLSPSAAEMWVTAYAPTAAAG